MYRQKRYYVYIMTNRSKTLYIGITGKIKQRVFQHKTGVFEGFTSRYKMDRLVYWEKFSRVHNAIAREKQLKGWRRIKTIQLIVSMNSTGKDLAEDWFPECRKRQMHRSFDCALAYARAPLRMTREGWRRIKKIQLIVSMNPAWKDLAEDWFPELEEKANA